MWKKLELYLYAFYFSVQCPSLFIFFVAQSDLNLVPLWVSQSVDRSYTILSTLPIHPSGPFSTARTHALHFQPLEATATTQQLLPRHTPRIYWKVGARSLHKLRNRTRIKPCLHLIKRCGACLCVECRTEWEPAACTRANPIQREFAGSSFPRRVITQRMRDAFDDSSDDLFAHERDAFPRSGDVINSHAPSERWKFAPINASSSVLCALWCRAISADDEAGAHLVDVRYHSRGSCNLFLRSHYAQSIHWFALNYAAPFE